MNEGIPSNISNKTKLPRNDLLAQVTTFEVMVRLSMLIILAQFYKSPGTRRLWRAFRSQYLADHLTREETSANPATAPAKNDVTGSPPTASSPANAVVPSIPSTEASVIPAAAVLRLLTARNQHGLYQAHGKIVDKN